MNIHTTAVRLIDIYNKNSRNMVGIGYLKPELVHMKHLLLGEFKYRINVIFIYLT